MVASIIGTVSRAEAGLVAPKSRSFNIQASRGGIAVHWGGTRQHIGSHDRCLRIWRAWQRYHMNKGWVDIAYNFGFCNHGFVFAGRGAGVRSAAQGTSDGNYRFEAAVWIGGSGDGNPTQLALNALDWIIHQRRMAGVGTEVRGHTYFTGTSCAGRFLNSHTTSLHNKDIKLPVIRKIPSKISDDIGIGVFRDGTWHLKNKLQGGSADITIKYGRKGDIPLVGDWTGNGKDTIGIHRGNKFFLKNSLSGGNADIVITFGREGDVPVVGDWSGNGFDTIGIRRGATFHLKNTLEGGAADILFTYGRDSDIPLIGDWNGNGVDTVSIKREGQYHLKNTLSGGAADLSFHYGIDSDVPVFGDWLGNGVTLPGIRRGDRWFIKFDMSGGNADYSFYYGTPSDIPLVGRW